MRDLIAESLGLQRLDVLVGRVLGELREPGDGRPRGPASQRPHLDSCVVPFGAARGAPRGIVSLGNKAFMLTRLMDMGFRVPRGFAVTTELARHPDGLAGPEGIPLPSAPPPTGGGRADGASGRAASGGRHAAPLLSVRAGAPVSMPGMLETFLNVGINAEVAAGMAATPR